MSAASCLLCRPVPVSRAETGSSFSARFARPAGLRPILALALAGAAAGGIWFGLGTLPEPARATLIVFALAIIAWSVLRLPETPVALAAGLALVLSGAIPSGQFYAGMGNPFIWLLIGAFVLAAVLRESGLAQRLVLAAVAGAGSVQRLFYRLTGLIVATAFVIPSTSGRATLLLPVFLTLAGAIPDRAVVRALALLFPTVILLSACASLLGAGAHLVAVDFLDRLGHPALGFADWALLGLPFALACSFGAAAAILHLFLDPAGRGQHLHLAAPPASPLTRQQIGIVAVTVAIVGLWASTPLHGFEAATVALAGALLVTWKRLSGVSLKQALKAVEWNLILFLAATLVMGEALIGSGAGQWLANAAVAALPGGAIARPALAVSAVALIAMVAHLAIPSRSARATVLIPALALPLSGPELAPAGLVVLTVVASGFCQTLKVSAKPVALYGGLDLPTYTDGDLLRLSLWLMPGMAMLLVVFALWIWPLQGLAVVTPG